jgi:hypothetical protein
MLIWPRHITSLAYATYSDILHLKWLHVANFFLTLAPCSVFLKESITRDVDALHGRVVEQTCLGAGLITDEHHEGAAIFKFLEPLASLLDKGYASKLMKMVHYRFHSMPY